MRQNQPQMRTENTRQVDQAYRHYQKLAAPRAGLALGESRLKWYNIAAADRPVPDGIADMARGYLAAEAAAGRLGLGDELGFVLLHRCGAEFYFLILCTWRGSNELWESVYFKQDDAAPGFSLFPQGIRHKGTYCVWEMGVVWRETKSWKAFLDTPRDQAAEERYLADVFAGDV
jgi:hypothetical protein